MIADPAPLGLAAFALTTFLLSLVNAGVMPHDPEPVMLGVALAFGGVAQLLAGCGNSARATFSAPRSSRPYGAFWLSFWAYLTFWIGGLTVIIGVGAAKGTISVGTFVTCYGSIIVLWATVTALRDRSLR